MRKENGVHYPFHAPKKPDFLVFVNSFFGLEIPRDLPPTCAVVGPLLSPKYPPLDDSTAVFLNSHQRTIYVALGTHLILRDDDIMKMMGGFIRLLGEDIIDGVIWSIAMGARQAINLDRIYRLPVGTDSKEYTMSDIISNKHHSFFFAEFLPQRAILDHDHTRIYFTHGGGSSANEGLYHGKPMISMGISGDQVANTSRLVANGVAEALSKFNFTADTLYEKAKRILGADAHSNNNGTQKHDMSTYQRHALRLMRIARVASRRKYHAADLVEEMLYDHELRFDDDGKELQPMHLQTADMRMPAYKVKNWDLMAVCAIATIGFLGSVGLSGKWLLRHRVEILNTGK
ncbi:UDP-glucoronosyl and UDP-glucosyl transferase [Ascosphaera apis ARSEF 7405]|uniref:UDP-glucoronosyl and UDP-glucosyl transferase n=1 Tax=Ascosphaera apis ARSEF 7405 TaxID=392613 RepID=A0A167XG02_9EURO|nr:UDP-glucoronosyl and UDP-glucosyl transferase [Ascosphaera apis ARSEF 7405]